MKTIFIGKIAQNVLSELNRKGVTITGYLLTVKDLLAWLPGSGYDFETIMIIPTGLEKDKEVSQLTALQSRLVGRNIGLYILSNDEDLVHQLTSNGELTHDKCAVKYSPSPTFADLLAVSTAEFIAYAPPEPELEINHVDDPIVEEVIIEEEVEAVVEEVEEIEESPFAGLVSPLTDEQLASVTNAVAEPVAEEPVFSLRNAEVQSHHASPVVEEVEPVVEEIVEEEAEPVVEEVVTVEEVEPVVEPVAEEVEPIIEEVEPVIEELAEVEPAIEEVEPTVEALEEVAPTIEEVAEVEPTVEALEEVASDVGEEQPVEEAIEEPMLEEVEPEIVEPAINVVSPETEEVVSEEVVEPVVEEVLVEVVEEALPETEPVVEVVEEPVVDEEDAPVIAEVVPVVEPDYNTAEFIVEEEPLEVMAEEAEEELVFEDKDTYDELTFDAFAPYVAATTPEELEAEERSRAIAEQIDREMKEETKMLLAQNKYKPPVLGYEGEDKKLIVVASLFAGCGSTFIANNMATVLANSDITSSVVEHLGNEPVLFEYLNGDQNQPERWRSVAHRVDSNAAVIARDYWQKDNISWFPKERGQDVRPTAAKVKDYMVATDVSQYTFLDISTNWNDPSLEEVFNKANEIWLIIKPNVAKIRDPLMTFKEGMDRWADKVKFITNMVDDFTRSTEALNDIDNLIALPRNVIDGGQMSAVRAEYYIWRDEQVSTVIQTFPSAYVNKAEWDGEVFASTNEGRTLVAQGLTGLINIAAPSEVKFDNPRKFNLASIFKRKSKVV